MNELKLEDCEVSAKERTCLERHVKVLHRPSGVFVVEHGFDIEETITAAYTALEKVVNVDLCA